jgi:hypothetical protein
MFDQMKRHAAKKNGHSKTNPVSLAKFASWIADKNFIPKRK